MPTIIRKPFPTFVETRRETITTVSWLVHSHSWHPPTDIYETEDQVVVKMEIAGVKEEDLEVVIQNDQLLIRGIRVDSTERRAYHQMEIPFGRFSVNIDLPVKVKIDDAGAEYKDGFLTIHLPKEN